MLDRHILNQCENDFYFTKNIFSNNTLINIKKIVDYGIENCVCSDVPKYQTYSNMHIVFQEHNYWMFFIERILTELNFFFKESYYLQKSWFNVCTKDSDFTFHTHENADIACVFYLDACANCGTIFNIDNYKFIIDTQDNTALFFNPKLQHSIPKWNNIDRYTIAMDFKKI